MTSEQALALRQQDEHNAMSYMLASPLGRAYLWEILDRCGVFGASFTGEALTTAFNEGKRHIGCQILSDAQGQWSGAMTTMRDEYLAREARYHVIPPTDQGDEE